MRGTLVALIASVSLTLPARIFAKTDLSKIVIKSPDQKAQIEINDPVVLANFNVWTGPGTGWTGPRISRKQSDNFIIDWSGGVTEPPEKLRRYQVCLYAKIPNEKLIYVVFYEYDSVRRHGYIYLPGKNDEWYRLNISTILHGVEGNWFRASSAWDTLAIPLIARSLVSQAITVFERARLHC